MGMVEPRPIYLTKALRSQPQDRILQEIGAYFRNVRISLSDDRASFTIAGPMWTHHSADSRLDAVCARLMETVSSDSIMSYRTSDDRIELCLEDSWSSYF